MPWSRRPTPGSRSTSAHAEQDAEGRSDRDEQFGAPEQFAGKRRKEQHGRPLLAESRFERIDQRGEPEAPHDPGEEDAADDQADAEAEAALNARAESTTCRRLRSCRADSRHRPTSRSSSAPRSRAASAGRRRSGRLAVPSRTLREATQPTTKKAAYIATTAAAPAVIGTDHTPGLWKPIRTSGSIRRVAAQAQSQDSRSARYAFALWALLGVFIFRVAAQGLLALGYGSSFSRHGRSGSPVSFRIHVCSSASSPSLRCSRRSVSISVADPASRFGHGERSARR